MLLYFLLWLFYVAYSGFICVIELSTSEYQCFVFIRTLSVLVYCVLCLSSQVKQGTAFR